MNFFYHDESVFSFIIIRFHTKPLSQLHDFTVNVSGSAHGRSEGEIQILQIQMRRKARSTRRDEQLQDVDENVIEVFSIDRSVLC